MNSKVYERALKTQVRVYNSMYEKMSKRYFRSVKADMSLNTRERILRGMERIEALIESCNHELYLLTA